ncbi:MAG: hypothetical protein QNJ44_00960 [Rhodobacter sp.]|nr:hypothetical protein [Rhodobacter sp.]
MTDRGTNLMSQLLAWVIEKRRPPNEALGSLLAGHPDIAADDLQLALLDMALKLEEMYDEACRDEWNDWLRVDQWNRMSSKDRPQRGGTAELLEYKSEVYRVIALISTDTIQLRRLGRDPVTGGDLLKLWHERRSGYL